VAGALFIAVAVPMAAQEATPAALKTGDETPAAELPAQATDAVGAGTEATAMPSTGVGPGLTGGPSALALGAAVGAAVAAAAALRERFKAS
jgi:hypothetical protein